MSIDVHTHAVPPQVLTALERDDGKCGVRVDGVDGKHVVYVRDRRAGVLQPGLIDTAARRAAMDEAGIDVQLVSSWIGVTAYDLPPEQGRRWARLFNDGLSEMVADRFLGMAMVPCSTATPRRTSCGAPSAPAWSAPRSPRP